MTHIIAIAGPSCSGKTTIACELARALQARVQAASNGRHAQTPDEVRSGQRARAPDGPPGVAVIGLDSYYHDLSHLAPEEIPAQNLDEPGAIEHALLIEHLAALAGGQAIDKPVYDHKTHSRSAERQRIEPATFLIMEGLFALYWEEIRRLTKTGVFIDAPHELCLARRSERDRSERGRTSDEVTRRYNTMVAPMYDRHVLPTRRYALIIVNGADGAAISAAAIAAHVTGSAAGGCAT
ncbi:MAG: uridine kinase [Candidatus Krumholzibacteriia bacterium]